MNSPKLVLLACLVLAACSSQTDPKSAGVVAPLVTGPSPQSAKTPANDALLCVAEHKSSARDLRIGVGEIVDGTGAKTFTDGASTLLTQRPDMMFAVALKKTGMRVLNRNATRVAEWEIAQSMEKRLGEGRETEIAGEKYTYRPVIAGTMLGTTHYVTGALTEVNWNIYSDDNQINVAGAFYGAKTYRISIALDLMVTDTETTEVVMAEAYSKQIIGKEISSGLFRFFEVDGSGTTVQRELFDASVGSQQNEPVQQAVRWLVEAATYDIASTLTNTKKVCDKILSTADPVAEVKTAPVIPPGGMSPARIMLVPQVVAPKALEPTTPAVAPAPKPGAVITTPIAPTAQ